MIRNYFTIALRNLRKSPLYSGLNIVGLSLGVAACLLIVLYVDHELSYDRWNANAARIVRPVSEINFGGEQKAYAVVSSVLGPDCQRELPEVQAFCRFRDIGGALVRRAGEGQSNIREPNVLYADSTFFELFPQPLLAGDARRCLAEPRTMAISRRCAEKFFGSAQLALGQTLVVNNGDPWSVPAVFEDLPAATHFQSDILLAMHGKREVEEDPPFWAVNNNFQNYLLLRPGTDLAAFERKFVALSREKLSVTAQQVLGISYQELEKTGQFVRYQLQRLPDIHLHSDLVAELQPNGNIRYVWIFSAIAAFILLIACINFMNLATARSAGRAREVGLRKVLGGQRTALIAQFLCESLVIAALAVGLALLLAALALPWYRDLTGRALTLPFGSVRFWLALGGGTLLVGLLAGSYPAFFLSAYNSLRVLKGQVTGLGRGASLRSALVVFQFTVSVALIVSTLLVFKQLNFIQTKKLGFEKSQVVIVDDAYALGDKVYSLKQEMLRHPAIEKATVSDYLPVPSSRNSQTLSKNRTMTQDNAVLVQRWLVDADYRATLGIELAQGRDFDPARVTDSTAVLLNEAAARLFGFGDNAVGQKIYLPDGNIQGQLKPEQFTELEVIGVVRDFHWASLRDNIGALALQLGKSTGLASFRYQGAATSEVVGALEKQWKSLSPTQPFSYSFLDESFARMYEAEQRIGKIAGIFALLSVLVSCLGLFGLAAFTTEQRTKEIGIRKVLGASVQGITALLARDFLRLVLIALVPAMLIAWWAMREWLTDFAYRVSIGWTTFAVAGLVAIAVAFLTVSFQSIKAALANPVKSLRNE
jgi:putative ABC transport system permease protein